MDLILRYQTPASKMDRVTLQQERLVRAKLS